MLKIGGIPCMRKTFLEKELKSYVILVNLKTLLFSRLVHNILLKFLCSGSKTSACVRVKAHSLQGTLFTEQGRRMKKVRLATSEKAKEKK